MKYIMEKEQPKKEEIQEAIENMYEIDNAKIKVEKPKIEIDYYNQPIDKIDHYLKRLINVRMIKIIN